MAPPLQQSRSMPRVDGIAKVTGEAKYVFDFAVPHLAHAAVVTSPIPRGEITGFSLDEAHRLPGVLGVFTYQDFAGKIKTVSHLMEGGYVNSSALPLGSPEIHYAGQIVALVVAETFEIAGQASELVKVHYRATPAETVLAQGEDKKIPLASFKPDHKDPGASDARSALEASKVTVDATYTTPVQHHNPIELFGTTCAWRGDSLTVYEATRYLYAAQFGLAEQLGIDPQNVRFICPYLGGHFGSRLALSQYTAPVALASRQLGRPVRYVASRSECFTIANHRPDTQHHIQIGATADGQFTTFIHNADMTTSRFDKFSMTGTDVTASLYKWGAVETKETVVRVDRNTPGPMRAPPEVPYLFAVESAVDELAAKLELDPVQLRLRNHAAKDPISGRPFTPRPLKECLEAGAKAFGWERRNARPAATRDGDWWVGFGCATSVRPVKRAPATVRISLLPDGHASVETAHHEIGNGLYTILAMETANQLGISVGAVNVRLGDSSLPAAGISGGSSTTTSLIPAIIKGCNEIRHKLATAVIAANGGFAGIDPNTVTFRDQALQAPDGRSIRLADAFQKLGTDKVEVLAEALPDGAGPEAMEKLRHGKLTLGSKESSLKWAFGAQFAEVRVHADTGEPRVTRLTGAFSAGYILNRLTALSQLRGGMIWGLGSALLEGTVVDTKRGRYVNDNLAEYLITTAADSCDLDAILLHSDDNPSDLMGLGELGIIGVNAAIANALCNATGRRVRSLPIRLEHAL